jgi:dihydroorotase-like cyclic amidohydrolase
MVREQAAQPLASHEIFDTHRHNPYQDFPLQTRVVATWIDGQLAYSLGSWLHAESSWMIGPGISELSTKL